MKNLAQFLDLVLSNPSARKTLIDISVGSMNNLSNMYNEYLDDVAWHIAYNRYISEQNNRKN